MIGFSLIVYILVSVVLGGAIVSKFNSTGQRIAAMISLVFLILIFTFFGLRWFEGGQVKGSEKKGAWPPIINMCPDYLTAVEGTTGTGASEKSGTFCVDMKGIYPNVPNTVDVIPSGSSSSVKGFMIKYPSTTTKAFTSLKEDANLPKGSERWPLLRMIGQELHMITQGDGKYVRWEGVWDGRSATAERAPLP